MARFNTSRPTGPVFPKSAPSAYPLFYRTYSRPMENGQRESWERVTRRCVEGLQKLGKLTDEQTEFLYRAQIKLECLSSGRWLWVGGTEWSEKPENFYGCYNCSSTNLKDWDSFAIMMDLAMQGCGTGAIIIDEFINQIPTPVNEQNVAILYGIGERWEGKTLQEHTEVYVDHEANYVRIVVGDSRKGWVDSYRQLLEISSDTNFNSSAPVEVEIDLGYVRPKGQKLVGFGGVSNPAKLPEFYEKIAKLLNKPAKDKRKLTSVECCLLIDEAAIVIVAGSIRRCLPEDALVHTSTGLIPIKDVQVGDLVQTSKGYKPVVDKFDQGDQIIYEIKTQDGSFYCSKDHKVAVAKDEELNYEMVKAIDLNAGDQMISCVSNDSDQMCPVEVLEVVSTDRVEHTYDIEVEEVHEFFADGYLVSNSAGIRQALSTDLEFAKAKDNLWQQDEDGNWFIDPERDALRMANHTRVFMSKPTRAEVLESVTKQFYSGEGAIQYAPEAIARCNVDLLNTYEKRNTFLNTMNTKGVEAAREYLISLDPEMDDYDKEHRMQRYGLNPCAEVLSADFLCNLSEVHLNMLSPTNLKAQEKAFIAGGLSVGVLLNHEFNRPRFKAARESDPIVGVSFTGLFDHFVHKFGVAWLQWWAEGRPETAEGRQFKEAEAESLSFWSNTAHQAVWDYCDEHGLKRPNRCTLLQPAGSKSLLTGASPGWHPPKAVRFIRRITFRKDDPVALACLDMGYSAVPSQSDKDENGKLLDSITDPRCTEWLIEIPTEVTWANLPGADEIDISKFSALAQFDFYMQVQKYYTTHNTSATIEYREHEIEPLANRIYDAIQNDEGYVSAALLARFDANETFPRLPFEPIDKETYDRLVAEQESRALHRNFKEALLAHDNRMLMVEAGPAGCDSDKCLLPLAGPPQA